MASGYNAGMRHLSHHNISADDARFAQRFKSGEMPAGEFHHRDHVRLAYIFLCRHEPQAAHQAMRDALIAFLDHHKVDPTKYHETITRAWILAVAHFMDQSAPTDSADAFIDANPRLLDPDIMLSHYSAQRLFSEDARGQFLTPDRAPIPAVGEQN